MGLDSGVQGPYDLGFRTWVWDSRERVRRVEGMELCKLGFSQTYAL